MAQTKPKAGQFYGVSGDGTAGQVLQSDGNGGMLWGSNTADVTVTFNVPTGQGLTYTQPSPQSSTGQPGTVFPTTTFTITKTGLTLSGTASISGLPNGFTYTQSYNNTNPGNVLTITIDGDFPDSSFSSNIVVSGLTLTNTVSWNTPTGQGLVYTQPSPQSSTGEVSTSFPTTTFTITTSNSSKLSGNASITNLPSTLAFSQAYDSTDFGNTLTITITGNYPSVVSLNTDLVISGLAIETPIIVDFLIIAGGGAGAWANSGSTIRAGGGGGAGGYRNSYNNETSGGGATSENSLALNSGTTYGVSIGAGAAAQTSSHVVPTPAWNGSNSLFHSVTSLGGGAGGFYSQPPGGQSGGSGGGGGGQSEGSGQPGGAGTAGQGYNGASMSGSYGGPAGGGGGAGEAGNTDGGGAGGDGLSSSITGTAVVRAGGGGGGTSGGSAGGDGGGGNGGNISVGLPGTANTGGGGGGGRNSSSSGLQNGGSGGSGIVILRYTNAKTIAVGSGLTATTSTVGTDKVTIFTAGTGTIQFN